MKVAVRKSKCTIKRKRISFSHRPLTKAMESISSVTFVSTVDLIMVFSKVWLNKVDIQNLFRETHLELISCCKRKDLTTGMLSPPNSGKVENSLVAPAECSPVTYLMSISNTSGSNLRTPSPKQNSDTISMKNVLQRWINLACISRSSFLVETLVLKLHENVREYKTK